MKGKIYQTIFSNKNKPVYQLPVYIMYILYVIAFLIKLKTLDFINCIDAILITWQI